MANPAKTKAEKLFPATRTKNEQALKEKEQAQLERKEHQAKLRALRLAKEAAVKAKIKNDTGEQVAKGKRQSGLPRSRRPLS